MDKNEHNEAPDKNEADMAEEVRRLEQEKAAERIAQVEGRQIRRGLGDAATQA